jgi:CO dehydrogenase maturation factor
VKIAISGKGGVGKTTLTALLAYVLAEDSRVSVVDADPSLNLALALGIPASRAAGLTPLSEMKELIQKRVGARDGGFFRLNPRVDDLAEKISLVHNGIRLLAMGTITRGGAGCACGENTLLRAFLSHLLLEERDVVLVDMEAGLEHLGRRTIQAVDALLVVVEPGQRSISVARRIKQLAADIGLRRVFIVGNKLDSPGNARIIEDSFPATEILGLVPYSPEILAADREGTSPFFSLTPAPKQELLRIKTRLTRLLSQI